MCRRAALLLALAVLLPALAASPEPACPDFLRAVPSTVALGTPGAVLRLEFTSPSFHPDDFTVSVADIPLPVYHHSPYYALFNPLPTRQDDMAPGEGIPPGVHDIVLLPKSRKNAAANTSVRFDEVGGPSVTPCVLPKALTYTQPSGGVNVARFDPAWVPPPIGAASIMQPVTVGVIGLGLERIRAVEVRFEGLEIDFQEEVEGISDTVLSFKLPSCHQLQLQRKDITCEGIATVNFLAENRAVLAVSEFLVLPSSPTVISVVPLTIPRGHPSQVTVTVSTPVTSAETSRAALSKKGGLDPRVPWALHLDGLYPAAQLDVAIIIDDDDHKTNHSKGEQSFLVTLVPSKEGSFPLSLGSFTPPAAASAGGGSVAPPRPAVALTSEITVTAPPGKIVSTFPPKVPVQWLSDPESAVFRLKMSPDALLPSTAVVFIANQRAQVLTRSPLSVIAMGLENAQQGPLDVAIKSGRPSGPKCVSLSTTTQEVVCERGDPDGEVLYEAKGAVTVYGTADDEVFIKEAVSAVPINSGHLFLVLRRAAGATLTATVDGESVEVTAKDVDDDDDEEDDDDDGDDDTDEDERKKIKGRKSLSVRLQMPKDRAAGDTSDVMLTVVLPGVVDLHQGEDEPGVFQEIDRPSHRSKGGESKLSLRAPLVIPLRIEYIKPPVPLSFTPLTYSPSRDAVVPFKLTLVKAKGETEAEAAPAVFPRLAADNAEPVNRVNGKSKAKGAIFSGVTFDAATGILSGTFDCRNCDPHPVSYPVGVVVAGSRGSGVFFGEASVTLLAPAAKDRTLLWICLGSAGGAVVLAIIIFLVVRAIRKGRTQKQAILNDSIADESPYRML